MLLLWHHLWVQSVQLRALQGNGEHPALARIVRYHKLEADLLASGQAIGIKSALQGSYVVEHLGGPQPVDALTLLSFTLVLSTCAVSERL